MMTIISLAVMGIICGGIFGGLATLYYVRMTPTAAENARRNAVKVVKENAALRHFVMDFVTKMLSKPSPPSLLDWEKLVDEMIIEGTPYSIRKALHQQCGTHPKVQR